MGGDTAFSVLFYLGFVYHMREAVMRVQHFSVCRQETLIGKREQDLSLIV